MKIGFPTFEQSKVLIVGDVMLDKYWHGGSSRISPEAPVQVVNVGNIEERPGGSGNVALNVASLGSKASIIGITGNDEAASAIQTRLQAAKVNCDFTQLDNVPTITKLRVISQQQQLIRMDFEEHFAGRGANELNEKVQQSIAKHDLLVLSDYAKGTLDDPQSLIQQAKQHNIPVLVDPKGTDFSRYSGATLVSPNLNEFEAVVGKCKNEEMLVNKGLELLKKYQWQALLITRGNQGMTLLRAGESEFHLPAISQEVYDVTGAGDTVIATLAASLAAGCELEQAVTLSNIAAGIVVAKLGTASVSQHEIRRHLRRAGDVNGGVLSKQQLKVVIDDAKAHKETIVMTNGCFDILHAGHVAYLKEAKKLGDRLVVAVNDDQSVTQLKGEGRPVNPINRRMSVLAGLQSVDWVVPFSEATPEALIELLMPDVLVKGGDYKVSEIAGAQFLQAQGKQVKVLKFIDDVSTTQIIDKISEQSGSL